MSLSLSKSLSFDQIPLVKIRQTCKKSFDVDNDHNGYGDNNGDNGDNVYNDDYDEGDNSGESYA